MDYKSTLKLPKTEFPMRAGLAQREPAQLGAWDEAHLYDRVLESRQGRELFVLHDGPPYANGHIHYGHILNKVLKDFVVKYQTLRGRKALFLPGWDCHGLPIELQAERDAGPRKTVLSKLEFRRLCRAYAERFVSIQRDEFRRLGVFGRWDAPYVTMSREYEATIVRELGRLVRDGYLYRGKRAVHWCRSCKTALAEAEVEYAEHTSPSIYVKFPLRGDAEALGAALRGHSVSFLIWTTTPWTLPANLAVALGPGIEYVAMELGGGKEAVVVAKVLAEDVARKCRLGSPKIICDVDPKVATEVTLRHPLFPRDSVVLHADFVRTDTGTGCVHIAPGHGEDDFQLGQRHGLDAFAPIDDEGRFTAEVKRYKGLSVEEANPKIVQHLQEASALLNRPSDTLTHSYPHCWRCKSAVLFRATPQWFCSLEKNQLRARSLEAIDATRWIPPWGRDRIYNMVQTRPDWCLSRQRAWGVPIPTFYCQTCNEPFADAEAIEHIGTLFREMGADVWFEREAKDLLPATARCRCGGTTFRKEQDIVDVWFESGVSWAAVCEGQPDLWPIDLYLEGSDQHRGWFHSSLLAAVATRGKPPYRAVLTHGFVVDEATGETYSKSARNFIPIDQIIGKYGAEILRVWVAYVDYRNDMPFGPKILDQLGESYRKLRNTWRFLLGNLDGFDPDRHLVQPSALRGLDRYMLQRLHSLEARVRKAYDEYDFQDVFRSLVEFASVDLSSLYLDVRKDRLYCDPVKDGARRGTQTVLWHAARALTIFAAPILVFTAEEVWQHLPRRKNDPQSVHLAEWPAEAAQADESVEAQWARLLEWRDKVNRALEGFRAEKHASLDARVEISASAEDAKWMSAQSEDLADLFIVSQLAIRQSPEENVSVSLASGSRCPRCWKYSVKPSPDGLCPRCSQVLAQP